MRAAILSHPQYIFMAWFLVEQCIRLYGVIVKHREKLYLLFLPLQRPSQMSRYW